MPLADHPGEFTDALGDAVVNAAAKALRHFLAELCDTQLGRVDDLAVVRLDGAGDYFQQGRFAAAVPADQADALARLQRQVDAIEQRVIAVAVMQISGL
jgi:hypothetical protein